jgi:large subunit ribosomal protein L23
MKINEIIVSPLLTEKATENAKDKVYMFVVNSKSTKLQVKAALEKIFSVKVGDVRMMVRKGKEVRRGRRMIPKKLADQKIAYVKLKTGKIDIFPQA